MIDCSPILGSSFKEGFGLVISVAFLLLLFKYLGGSNQFLSSKRFPDILPAPGHGVLSQTGAFSKGGGLFSGASVWGLTLTGALETVTGGHVAVSLGFGAVLGLNLLVGTALFLFCVALSFLTLALLSS